MSDENPMGQVIQIDEARIRDHLGEMVRGTVEETLNAMLDAEADQLCGAGRYERSQARQDTRAWEPRWMSSASWLAAILACAITGLSTAMFSPSSPSGPALVRT